MGKFQEYKTQATTVKAAQWFKNGDHPEDRSYEMTVDGHTFLSEGQVVRRFRHPKISGEDACDQCGHDYDRHGWIDVEGDPDGLKVCPSDYVITNEVGDIYPTSKEEFESTYNLREGYGG